MNPYDERDNWSSRFNGGMTPAVKALLLANLAVFMLEFLLPWNVLETLFALSSDGIRHGFIWQFFTYMFLHSPSRIMHIIFNMLVLFMMGPETERGLGTRRFLIVYLGSGLVGGIFWIALGLGQVPCIGASGAVYGVLGAFAALWPNRPMTLLILFILPVTLKAWMLVCGLALIELVMSLGAPGSVAHAIHLVGTAVGVGCVYLFLHRKPRPASPFHPRLRVIHGGRPPRSEPDSPPPEYVSTQTVDALLDKIANQGMQSLTRHERTLLETASRQRNTSPGQSR